MIPGPVHDPFGARGERDLAHFGEQAGPDRDAGFPPPRRRAAFRIAGDHDGLGRVGRPRGAQRVAEGRDVGAEIGRRRGTGRDRSPA